MIPDASQEPWPERPLPVAQSLDAPGPGAAPGQGATRTVRPVLPAVAGDADATGLVAAEPFRWTMRETTSFFISFVLHLALLIVLSLIVIFAPPVDELTLVVNSNPSDGVGCEEEAGGAQLHAAGTGDAADGAALEVTDVGVSMSLPASRIIFGPSETRAAMGSALDANSASRVVQSAARRGGGFEGRSGEGKGQLLARGGGTPASENAVALALAWLAAHQGRDGGWRLDLNEPPCGGRCRNSGTVGTTTGATGLALLPFLGAGQTQLEGPYQEVVNAGLYYLKGRGVPTANGLDLQEGTMYAQGIAAVALCEAYGMTKDETLREPAQRAIDFICAAQHSGGGWRYYPQQPGDTTVFGWQMMAIKSATMAGLSVPTPVLMAAERFLDSVQTDGGAGYGYNTPTRSPGPTAIGLLIRMYTGWEHYDPRLQRGVAYLAREGPSKTDMYFNYYATQVMHHYNGPSWPSWNQEMRDYLVRTQATAGYERGSWFFDDPHGAKGGRLYTTAMCAMILEVYYRHMPLYEASAVGDDL
jgi:hypothetical protein